MVDAAVDSFAVTIAAHNSGVVFIDTNLTGATQHVQSDIFQFNTQFVGNNIAAGQGSDILQHSFLAVAKARSLNSHAGECATQFVNNQSSSGFALNVVSDNQQLTASLHNFFQNRQQFLHGSNFLLNQQNEWVVQNSFHFIGISYHVGADIAAVKLHAFNHIAGGFKGLAVFNGDNAVFANFFHGLGNQFADFRVIGGNRSNLSNSLFAFNLTRILFDVFHSSVNRFVNAAFQDNRVGAGGNILNALVNDSLSQNAGRSGAVAGYVVGLGSNFFNQLSAHVLGSVFQVNFLGNAYTVVGNQRRAKFALQNYIAAFGPQSYFNRISQSVNTALQSITGVFFKNDLFSHSNICLLNFYLYKFAKFTAVYSITHKISRSPLTIK